MCLTAISGYVRDRLESNLGHAPALSVASGRNHVSANTGKHLPHAVQPRVHLSAGGAPDRLPVRAWHTDCYASPLALARLGSAHGYDVTNHGVLNPEIGNEEQLFDFARQLQSVPSFR